MSRSARRLAVVVAAATLPLVCADALPASAATAAPSAVSPDAGGWWACIAVQALNGALCVGDPLPNQLPLI